VNFPRDFSAHHVADVALVRDGDRCARCGGTLRLERGIELGHIFKLGTKYSQALGATFLDRDGRARPLVMGCYGIGIGRLLAAVVEAHHDEAGIVWPVAVAPFHVLVSVLGPKDPAQLELGTSLAEALARAGLDVLLDDRERTAGEKFHDAKLVGIPVLVTVGPRSLRRGEVDLERRRDGLRTSVSPASPAVHGAVQELLRGDGS